MALKLRSTAFQGGEMIPSEYTCDGDGVSPPVTWLGVPDDAQSLVLILEDIDSVKGVWSHWVVYDIPPGVNALAEGIRPSKSLSQGGVQGRNDFDSIGYGGPCPSDGKVHRYVLRLYALDTELGLEPAGTREDILDSIEGHVIREVDLMGRYALLEDR
jgi:Raf kinase inhibitor-like YbhB/YbcL family protein